MPFETVSAHCDIPCKIYDPSAAQVCALTMIRLIDLANEITAKAEQSVEDRFQLIRLSTEKEQHGVKLKEEVRIIWGDYFKAPQIESHPNIHKLVHNIMMQASKTKQHMSRDIAEELLTLVNEFSDIFWQTKQVSTYKAICPYPPALPVVYPQLNAI